MDWHIHYCNYRQRSYWYIWLIGKIEVMDMLKDDVKQIIDNLPDDCSLEDIQYTLYVKKKIQQGQDDLNEGRVVTHEEMEKRMSK